MKSGSGKLDAIVAAIGEPYFRDDAVAIYHSDCRDILPKMPKVDLVLTDPPYGIHKAGWDDAFPNWFGPMLAQVATGAIAVMPGINNLLRMPQELSAFEYRWTLAVQLSNGMTRGLMGFGNWIPILVYAKPDDSLYQPQRDCAVVPIVGEMPNHPCPKPLLAMRWVIERFPNAQTILDPFMGSGTTLRAAKDLGRLAIGIEIEEKYCEIAAQRMAQGVLL